MPRSNDPVRESLPRRLLRDQVRGWVQRKPMSGTGNPRFVKVEDDLALIIMRSAFEHAPTWAVFWAVFWKTQVHKVYDKEGWPEIGVDDLTQQTGYARASVFRALAELKDRNMVTIESGGGRHRKSTICLTDADEWLL